jgi:hypothetical protein
MPMQMMLGCEHFMPFDRRKAWAVQTNGVHELAHEARTTVVQAAVTNISILQMHAESGYRKCVGVP